MKFAKMSRCGENEIKQRKSIPRYYQWHRANLSRSVRERARRESGGGEKEIIYVENLSLRNIVRTPIGNRMHAAFAKYASRRIDVSIFRTSYK